jgi:hypothetical protein
MNPTTIRHADSAPVPRDRLISETWIVDAIRDVRDLLQAEGRDVLASTLSMCLGGLQAAEGRVATNGKSEARDLLDSGPDFEESAEWPDDPAEWPAWTDESRWTTDEPTPLELLAAFGVPAISGGAPAFEPSEQDWADYFAHRDNPLTEDDVRIATGSC